MESNQMGNNGLVNQGIMMKWILYKGKPFVVEFLIWAKWTNIKIEKTMEEQEFWWKIFSK